MAHYFLDSLVFTSNTMNMNRQNPHKQRVFGVLDHLRPHRGPAAESFQNHSLNVPFCGVDCHPDYFLRTQGLCLGSLWARRQQPQLSGARRKPEPLRGCRRVRSGLRPTAATATTRVSWWVAGLPRPSQQGSETRSPPCGVSLTPAGRRTDCTSQSVPSL